MGVVPIQWQKDLAVLETLRTWRNDKLNVVDHHLELTQGTYKRFCGAFVTPEPLKVAEHIQKLVDEIAKPYFEDLKNSPSDLPEYYEKVEDFKGEVALLAKRASDLQFTFRSNDIDKEKYAAHYSQLHDSMVVLREKVENYKNTLKTPPSRSVKNITYNKDTELNSIIYLNSERVSVAGIVAAAKQALALAPKFSIVRQPLYLRCIIWMTVTLLSLPLLVPAVVACPWLTTLKVVLWNPVEFCIRGEVRTLSPNQILLGVIINILEASHLVYHDPHMEAYQHFVDKLVKRSVITDEIVEAFEALAPKAECLDLKHIVLRSDDITEFQDLIPEDKRPGAIPVAEYLEIMKDLPIKTLMTLKIRYTKLNTVYLKREDQNQTPQAFFNEDATWLGAQELLVTGHWSADSTYITPTQLTRLVNAASSSPTCRDIKLPNDIKLTTLAV